MSHCAVHLKHDTVYQLCMHAQLLSLVQLFLQPHGLYPISLLCPWENQICFIKKIKTNKTNTKKCTHK